MQSAMELVGLALRAPYVRRQALLASVLERLKAGNIDGTVPRVEAASPTVRLSALFCIWAKSMTALTSVVQGDQSLPLHTIQLIRLANKVGQPHISRLVVDRVRQRLGSLLPSDSGWFEFELQAAKCQRLLGEYTSAVATYERLLQRASSSSPYYVPKVLLNLGKMSHTYEWRTGLYLQLARIAESRFHELLADDSFDPQELRRQLAICIDCVCQTELSISNGSGNQAVFERWSYALSLCSESSGNSSYWRIWLRRAYAKFQVAEPLHRSGIIDEYMRGLERTERDLDERRGLAVRYGQLAEMLGGVGRMDEAVQYLRAALEYSRQVSDWRLLAGNAIRSSVLHLRFKVSSSGDEVATMESALERLRGSSSQSPIDVEVALLRQLARHHSAHGDTLRAKERLDEVVDKFEAFERRILAEATGLARADTSPSIQSVLSSVLRDDERSKIRDAGMVDYTILSRFERSVIGELLDTISSDVRHLGSKQKVSLSRLAVSTVLHDQKGRTDRLLSELRGHYAKEFAGEQDSLTRVLHHLTETSERVQIDFNAGLENFAPRSDRGQAISISTAFELALQRGRFRNRYSDVEFSTTNFSTQDFEIAIDPDLLITVLDGLLQNAATAVSSFAAAERRIIFSWEWNENTEQLNPMAYIRIEDSGGAVDQLEKGLAHGRPGRYGLQLARIFFVDALRGEMSAGGVQGLKTVLCIALQASQIVRQLVSL